MVKLVKNRENKKRFRDWATGKTNSDRNDWRRYIREQSRIAGVNMTAEDVYEAYWSFFEQDQEEPAQAQPDHRQEFIDNLQRLSNLIVDTIDVTLDLTDEEERTFFTSQLEQLNFSGSKRYYIKYGNQYYTISGRNIKQLTASLSGEEVKAVSESDRKIEEWVKSGENITIGILANPEGLLIDTDEDEAPTAAWFPYYLKSNIPLDLTRYDIHKDSTTEDLTTNCFLNCLSQAGIVGKELDYCKTIVKNRSIPEKDIRKVCEKLKVNIHIGKYNKEGLKKINNKIVDKEYPTIKIFNSLNHYFLDEKITDFRNQITKYALLNWEDIKHLKNPKHIYAITDKQIKRDSKRVIKLSSQLVQILIDNKDKLLEKKKVNNILLDSQFWDKEKEFETLEYDMLNNTSCNTDKRLKKFGATTAKDYEYCATNGIIPYENIPPVATYVADFETISAQDLPKVGDNGVRVFSREKAKEKTVEHKPYFFSIGEYGKTDTPTALYLENEQISVKNRFTCIVSTIKDYCIQHFPNGADCSPRSKERLRIIFHNAGYDIRFFRPYLTDYQQIDKGSKLVSGTGIFRYEWKKRKLGVKIEIRDSYGLIPVSLGNFGKIFPTISQEKEILPYSFYTEKNCLEKNYILNTKDLDEYQELEDPKDREQFLTNCRKWRLIKQKGVKLSKNIRVQKSVKEDGDIDMKTYSGRYCIKDVEVLREGLSIYQKSITEISKDNPNGYKPIDALDYVSLPSLIFDILLMKGCFDDTYTVSGVPQQFIQRCVVGGRCMLKDNEKQYYEEKQVDGVLHSIQDYDSVSCYTSAFVRMKGLIKGRPKPIKGSEYETIFNTTRKNNKYINSKVDAYFIKILITKVNKKRHFPVISAMRGGIREWSNDLEGAEIYCDNLALDDFIEFQGVEFKIVEGYYFNEGFNPKIVEVMRDLFQKRIVAKNNIVVEDDKGNTIEVVELDSKLEGLANKAPELVKKNIKRLENKYYGKGYTIKKYKNPIEVVYKLLLNSCYGKMLLKEIETDSEYVKKKGTRRLNKTQLKKLGLPPDTVKWEEYSPFKYILNRHYNKIRKWEDCGDEVKITYWKSINDHHNNVHQGVQVLSYAKRLMNEVICLAEDINAEILYTDTDSIHIVDKHIPILEKAFTEKYGRQLRGEDLNQFNEDFDSHIKNCRSVKFIGLGKKCYIDVLKGDGEEVDYHIRLKGCPNQSILREVERRKITPEDLYELLYNDTRISFDLLKKEGNHTKSRFVFNTDWTITNETNFSRSIVFSKEKKELVSNIINGKTSFWGKSQFHKWRDYNKVVLNIQSEVEQL